MSQNTPQFSPDRSNPTPDPVADTHTFDLLLIDEMAEPDRLTAQRSLNEHLAYLTRRGLPGRGDLFKLSEVYIDTQRRLWPQLAESVFIPKPIPEVIAKTAAQFALKFQSKEVPAFEAPEGRTWDVLGTSYLRYSSSQQNPRSLDDQLALQLNRARSINVFIPWHYVFADAAMSGMSIGRVGYMLTKAVLEVKGAAAVDVLFVDELARATRNAIETLMLDHFVKNQGKRIIGVSDGFDTREEHSKILLHVNAMVNEQAMVQHSYRVLRGKDGAARRGVLQGKLPLGVKAVAVLDRDGNPTQNHRGGLAKIPVIDEEGKALVNEIAEKFVDDRVSLTRIAKDLEPLKMLADSA